MPVTDTPYKLTSFFATEPNLESAYSDADIRRVHALADAYEPEDFDRVVRAVRRLGYTYS